MLLSVDIQDMLKNVIKRLCLEICPVSAIHNDSEFLTLNPAPGQQIQSGEVLHPDVGSISKCKLSPDFNLCSPETSL